MCGTGWLMDLKYSVDIRIAPIRRRSSTIAMTPPPAETRGPLVGGTKIRDVPEARKRGDRSESVEVRRRSLK